MSCEEEMSFTQQQGPKENITRRVWCIEFLTTLLSVFVHCRLGTSATTHNAEDKPTRHKPEKEPFPFLIENLDSWTSNPEEPMDPRWLPWWRTWIYTLALCIWNGSQMAQSKHNLGKQNPPKVHVFRGILESTFAGSQDHFSRSLVGPPDQSKG